MFDKMIGQDVLHYSDIRRVLKIRQEPIRFHHVFFFKSFSSCIFMLSLATLLFIVPNVLSKFVKISDGIEGPVQSETYIQCYFNPMCFCKYDQKTEIYEAVTRLWQFLRFNSTEFQKSLGQAVELMTSDPNTIYFFSPNDIVTFSYVVANSSTGSRQMLFEPGPVFDMECTDVPIALIPTEYSAHGVISHVSVSGSKLTMLDGSAFAGLDIQGIRLSKNHLYYISEYAFSSMSSSLSMLDLSANSLDEIPFTAFRTLKLLEWLNLSNNLLISLSGDWFGVNESLRKLLLASNSIDRLPHKLLPVFSRLSWLDLSFNFVRNISVGSLPPNLQTLNLMRNRLTQFPSAVFHLESLTWLFLGGCAIETIPENWPSGLTPLQMSQMDLSENYIQVWPPRPFGTQLIVLDLSVSRNYLNNLPAAAFESMNIFRLSLGFNRLRSLDIAALQTLETTLKYLNLENNQLERIPWDTLQNMTSLMHLYIGSNIIQDEGIEPNEGTECKLTYLGLNGNQLTRLPRRLLTRCPHLFHLNLGYNQIIHLDDFLHFRGKKLRNLNTLILRNNPIRTMSYGGRSIHGNQQQKIGSGLPLEEDWGNYNEAVDGLVLSKSNNNLDNEINPLLVDIVGERVVMKNGIKKFDEISPPSSSSFTSIPNLFRSEVFPNLRELSLSFCQLSGELEPFPTLPLTTLEISMGLKTATTLNPNIFHSLRSLEWLALDHNSIQTISEYTFYSNRKLSYVNLEWNRFTTLPPLLFHPEIHTSISHLRLSHNKISVLEVESFLSFPAINLDLSYNLISRIEPRAFAEFSESAGGRSPTVSSSPIANDPGTTSSGSSLSPPSTLSPYLALPSTGNGGILDERPGLSVYLSHNRLQTLKSNSFAMNKFALVDLSWNKLSWFNFDVFGGKTIIGGLNLSHNELERIFITTEKYFIKILDLSYNRIQSKAMDFSFLCVTETIDLSFNRLEKIEQYLFPRNCSLKELKLTGNVISSLDSGSFTNLRDLTVLRLGENQLTRLPTITFIRNTKLKFLDLSSNRLRTIPRDGLVGSAIEILNLNSNQFVTIPIGALSQIARRLKRLDMSCNWIEHLDSTMFESIPGLVSLNLSSNRLSTLPDSAFANLASLRELDLSKNFLRANFKELFHFLPKLKVLRLSGCGVRVLPFLPLPHLISLDLSSNGLHEIKMQSLSSLGRLRILDLSSNELVGPKLPSWSSLYNLVSLKLSKNPLKSFTRDTLYGLGRLEKLEVVDMGRIDRFDSDVFSHLHNLRSLAVETYPNIEKYRFRLGAVLSSIPYLEELLVKIKESTLSDQLLGGILPKLRKLTITGPELRRIESGSLEGLQNSFHMELSIIHTGIDEVPSRIFDLLQNQAWSKLDLSFNKMSSLDSAALYPNRTIWFSKGTKILEGGLILDGNEFICDCDLVWIGEWLRRWLRESFQSHSRENIPLVHSMYESIRRPTCTDSKGRVTPLIELYSEVMCHASALSGGSTLLGTSSHLSHRSGQLIFFITTISYYILIIR